MERIEDINSLFENDSFLAYALDKDTDAIKYWGEYMNEHPEDKDEIEKAKELILFLESGKKQLPFNKARYELKGLNKNIDFHEMQNTSFSDKSRSHIQSTAYLWMKIAAVLVIFFAIAAVLLKTNVLPYNLVKSESIAEEISANQIIVPLGEKSHVILADGTEIWLNSGSKLIYPTVFNRTERIVKLEGEGYFNVAKNKEKPFIVETDKLDIEVLGTSFNLKSYPEEDIVETTLVEGSVKLSQNRQTVSEKVFYLKPLEKADFRAKESEMTIHKVVADEDVLDSDKNSEWLLESIISWKDQVLIFNSENLIDIATKLERWYGFKIILKDIGSVINETYTGKFIHNEPITMVLDIIKATTPIAYKIENNTITITGK